MPARADVEVGAALPERTVPITRADLVRYAGASGDHNVIHWNQRVATAVGLPDVIAHGMLTMALAGQLASDWVGDPGAVEGLTVRFSRPVAVPDDDSGATLVLSGIVEELTEQGRAVVGITATVDGTKVLMAAKAVVRLS
ncbi:MAG: MaoC family dehydratase N-terminal domain-containing protein [Frankiales bacterium]|nr:MaoC family dehydratase N-terminal domain-containing protein [Frankiales bacterium]